LGTWSFIYASLRKGIRKHDSKFDVKLPNGVLMVDKTLRITDVSLVLDLLSPRKAAKLGMVPLMHSSWKQMLEELEAIDKLKELEKT